LFLGKSEHLIRSNYDLIYSCRAACGKLTVVRQLSYHLKDNGDWMPGANCVVSQRWLESFRR
jgi:hypothetical protein